MRVDGWLEEGFGSPLRVRVLRHLDQSPRMEHTLRDVARAMRVGPSSVRAAIHALVDAGLIDSRRIGRSDALGIRRGFARSAIRRIFEAERSLRSQISALARRTASKGTTIVLFGSGARGEQTKSSDLDLLVVAKEASRAEDDANAIQTALDRIALLRLRTIALPGSALRSKANLPWVRAARLEGQVLAGPTLEDWL